MAYTGNPASSLTDRLRLEVGDIDELDEGLSDSVYQYILDSNGNTTTGSITTQSIVQALKYLVGKYANCIDEEVGDIKIKDSRYNQYKGLLDKYIKDPRYSDSISGLPYAGGISIEDIEANANNSDANHTYPNEDWFKTDTLTELKI